MATVFQFLAEHPIVVLFVLIGVGAPLGRVRVAGVSLGAVGVLFVAIGITAWGVSTGVTIEMPAAVGDLGLVVSHSARGSSRGRASSTRSACATPSTTPRGAGSLG